MVGSLGCAEEDNLIDLDSIERAPGGNLAPVVSLETDDSEFLVVPFGNELFVRESEEPRWNVVRASWPSRIDEPGLGVYEVASSVGRDAQTMSHQYFTEFDGMLWTVALPAATEQPRLLRSEDLGRTWREVGFPRSLHKQGAGTQPAKASLNPQIRLMTTESDLYLIGGAEVWRLMDYGERRNGTDSEQTRWESVTLDGVSLDSADDSPEGEEVEQRSRRERALPRSIRHYQAAETSHPYELLTIYGRHLEIYRRDEGEEQFQRVSTLDALDSDLAREPDGDSIFLVDSELLYRSHDRGETWDELEVYSDSLAPEKYRQIEIFEEERAETGTAIWLMGEKGSLWLSENDGEGWDELMERDPDGRRVTGLIQRQGGDVLWASTAGRGMLRSEDRGVHWSEANTGLRAGRSFRASLTGDRRMYVGTDSGLYERSTQGRVDDWSRVDDRAISAFWRRPEDHRLVSGTVGGGILIEAGAGEQTSSEAAPLGGSDQVAFAPPHLAGMVFPRTAIITIRPRPDSRDVVAWSHRKGPMISNDEGESWRRMQLGEAFLNALDSAVISSFLAMPDQTYFVVTRSRRSDEPTQLWRSVDGGRTWQATYSMMESSGETPLQLEQLPDHDEGLLMAHGSRVAVSTDRGETWSPIAGPWESGVVIGITVDGGEVAVAINAGHSTEIVWVTDLLQGGRIIQQYRLDWPPTRGLHADRPLDLEVLGDEVLLHEGSRIYSGQLPRRRTGGPTNVSFVVAVGVLILLITMAFGVLRTWETS